MKFKKLKDFEPFIENEETHKQLIKYLDEDNQVKQWEYCVGSCKGCIQRRKELLKNKKLDKEERKIVENKKREEERKKGKKRRGRERKKGREEGEKE